VLDAVLAGPACGVTRHGHLTVHHCAVPAVQRSSHLQVGHLQQPCWSCTS
jgi:hypothetical protein